MFKRKDQKRFKNTRVPMWNINLLIQINCNENVVSGLYEL